MKKIYLSLAATTFLTAAAQAATMYHLSFGGQALENGDISTGGAENVISTYSGVSVDDVAGDDTFNDIGQSFNATLIADSAGSTTSGVTAQIGGWQGINPADGAGAGHAFGSNVPDAVMTSLIYGSTHTITVANLDPSSTYKVEWFTGLSGGAASINNSVAINGGTSVPYNMGNLHGNGTAITFDNVSLGTYSDEFNNQRTNALQLVVTGDNAVSQYVRITAVPEPSSTALIGLGGLALLFRRRK